MRSYVGKLPHKRPLSMVVPSRDCTPRRLQRRGASGRHNVNELQPFYTDAPPVSRITPQTSSREEKASNPAGRAKADPTEIRRAIELLIEPQAVVELRAPIRKNRVVSGYYENTQAGVAALVRDATVWNDQAQEKNRPEGLYISLNPIDPALLARSWNRATDYAKHTTADADVVRRRWLPIDCDVTRPAGISSTDGQHQMALALARQIRAFLQEYGITTIEADSGNGGHLLVPVDLPNDDESRVLLERVLKALAHRFDTDQVHVDLTTFNAARIYKLYGTVAGKGDSTPDRPHRLARILDIPDTLHPASIESLREMVAQLAEEPKDPVTPAGRRGHGSFSIDRFMSDELPEAGEPVPYKGGRMWKLPQCLFNPAHTDGEAAIIELPNGALAYKCFHNSCRGRDWHAVRDLIEPGWRDLHSGNGKSWPEKAPLPGDEDAPPPRRTPGVNGRANGTTPPAEPAEWDPVIPLELERLPAFPLDSLPDPIADMVRAVSVATQTPPDAAAMVALSVLAVGAAKRVEAMPKPGWKEPLVLWTLTALASGNAKTAVVDDISRPVVEYQAQLEQDMAYEIAARQVDREIAQARLEKIKKEAVRTTDGAERQLLRDEAAGLAAELAQMPPAAAPRLLCDDTTPEKLGMLMEAQGGRIAVLSAEGGVFAGMMGHYSSGQPNLDVYKKGHSGDPVQVDRVGRPPVHIERPALTLGLLIQPGVIGRLNEKDEFRDEGLLARFLYSFPDSWVGHRDADSEPVPDEVRQRYARLVRRLLELPADADEHGKPRPHILTFTDAARAGVVEYRAQIEPRLGEGGDLAHLADWGSKLHGALVRIAALLHLADSVDERCPWEIPVTRYSVEVASQICAYLIPHAKAAFGVMVESPVLDKARYILNWIIRKRLTHFTRREAHQALQRRFPQVTDLDQPLAVLCERGYIRHTTQQDNVSGGRPVRAAFVVNPNVLAER